MSGQGVYGTQPEHFPRLSRCSVTLNGVADTDFLEEIGDGRTIEILDVTYEFLGAVTLTSSGNAEVVVGVLEGAASGTPTRKVTLRMSTAAPTTLTSGTKFRLSQDASLDGGTTTGISYSATFPTRKAPAQAVLGALVSSPAVMTYEYVPSAGADETGTIMVEVLWRYADAGRDVRN